MTFSSNIFSVALVCVVSAFSVGCQSFYYKPDVMEVEGNAVAVENVGYNGFRVNPPTDFLFISALDGDTSAVRSTAETPNGFVHAGRSDLDYHYHQQLVYQLDNLVLFIQPFRYKPVNQFANIPKDLKEKFLARWTREALLPRFFERDYELKTYSNNDDQSWITMQSDIRDQLPTEASVIMTGYLNEMFWIGGSAPNAERRRLIQAIETLRASIEVKR